MDRGSQKPVRPRGNRAAGACPKNLPRGPAHPLNSLLLSSSPALPVLTALNHPRLLRDKIISENKPKMPKKQHHVPFTSPPPAQPSLAAEECQTKYNSRDLAETESRAGHQASPAPPQEHTPRPRAGSPGAPLRQQQQVKERSRGAAHAVLQIQLKLKFQPNLLGRNPQTRAIRRSYYY